MANLSNINNKFIVTDGGNVLIGNTANSSGRLQIKDTQTSSFNDGLAITRNNAAQTGYINMVGGAFNFNSPGLSYKFRNNGTQTLELNSSGDMQFNGNATISSNTADGSDNAQLIIAGGGTDGDSRGASVHISGNESGNGGLLQLRAGNGSISQIRSYTSALERMRILSNGNVGIGNTNPTSALSISKSMGAAFIADFINPAVNGHGLLIQAGGTTGTRYITQWKDALGTERFHMEDNGEAYFQGNVGIGVTSPGNKLTIASGTGGGSAPDSRTLLHIDKNGEAYISINSPAESFNGIRLNVAGTPKAFMELYDNTAQGKKLNIGTVDARDLVFDTGNQPKMVILSGGNVGIGTTTPETPLHVLTNTTDNASTMLIQNGSTGDASIKFNISGDTYSIGIDNSDGDKFKLSYGAVGTNDRIVVDTTGNVGIGTTSPGYMLDVNEKIRMVAGLKITPTTSTLYNQDGALSYYSTSNGVYLNGAGANGWLRLQGSGVENDQNSINIYGSASAYINFRTSNVERMRINSSGNVGIGTTSPDGIFHVDGGGASIYSIFSKSDTKWLYLHTGGSNPAIGWDSAGDMRFGTSTSNVGGGFSEKMRITSGGNVLIGTDSTTVGGVAGHKLVIDATSQNLGIKTASGSHQAVRFANGSTAVGSINLTTSSTSYNTSSDYRLKEDLQDFNGLDKVSKIPVYDFKWKTDESRSYGVMAHELQEVLPDAVVGEKDAEEMQSVDYSKIVPLLVKSIQELKAEIELLKSK